MSAGIQQDIHAIHPKQPLELIFFGRNAQEEPAPLLGESRMIQNGAELQSSSKIKRSPGSTMWSRRRESQDRSSTEYRMVQHSRYGAAVGSAQRGENSHSVSESLSAVVTSTFVRNLIVGNVQWPIANDVVEEDNFGELKPHGDGDLLVSDVPIQILDGDMRRGRYETVGLRALSQVHCFPVFVVGVILAPVGEISSPRVAAGCVAAVVVLRSYRQNVEMRQREFSHHRN
ncbi:hypothetical protein PROFUN_01816 [Planoprotostelium fungivorum]|uniref:Uncharacterized protein n=1 Tax=Planoprotostelium fungivorum TaxID=1890364 RepID=A0A2P6NYQ9_9EUKA|nr:hypothetical protein PROFUN_01816 [Planoprotostelium fungivorum]